MIHQMVMIIKTLILTLVQVNLDQVNDNITNKNAIHGDDGMNNLIQNIPQQRKNKQKTRKMNIWFIPGHHIDILVNYQFN